MGEQQATTKALDDIKDISIEEIEKEMARLKREHPKEFEDGIRSARDVLESHRDPLYFYLVRQKHDITVEEKIRVQYVCVLQSLGIIGYI